MGWGQRWPEREPRPKVQHLSVEKQNQILSTLNKGIESSPVLSFLGIRARILRGRFYLERLWSNEKTDIEIIGRITPLTTKKQSLLLEVEKSKGNWYEIKRGEAKGIISIVASDTKGTFHGLGALDKSLMETGLNRLDVEMRENCRFFYKKTGELCTVQEALFHYFGIPIPVIAEPREWYIYHRGPEIVEASEDKTKVLVEFTAMSFSGESFGGTCLYAMIDDRWNVFKIRPNQSGSIASAIAWLEKRKWLGW